jgi:LuxR family maltose regulon positive regulatory protein
MAVSLLTTKLFFPPVRHGYVPRPRLIERLRAGLRGPLTLLSAPAGYGKTTLLGEWRAGLGQDFPAAWLSLDESDNDLILFLRYVTAALQSAQPGLVDRTRLLLQSPQPPPLEAALTSLLNDVSGFPDDFALVLDDYQVITTPAIHDALSFLLARAPPHMHLVLLTREDPPLPLPRLRARGQVVEIREADLCFSLQEGAAFLAQTMGLALSEETVAGLVARTEGWAAGLQMAGLSLQKEGADQAFAAAFHGRDRYVMDYLMDEVFRQQSDHVRDFMLQTSILNRLSAPLCGAVLEVGARDLASTPDALPSSQDILEYLDRANLFVIPLDNRRQWYRYHHLFADLLRYRLQRECPSSAPELHRRACRWYAQAGHPDEAMHHALAAADDDLAAGLAEQFALHTIGSSRLGAYLDWIQQLPEELVCRRAYLCAGCGWAYVLTHQVDAAVRYVEAGEAALDGYEPVSNPLNGRWISHEEVRGHLAAIRSYADRELGDLGTAIEHAHQALETLPREALAIRCAVALNLGFLHWDRGEIKMARQAFAEAFETAQESRENVYVAISALGSLGSIAALQGKLNEAEDLFQRAIQCGTSKSGAVLPIPAAGLAHGSLALLHYQRNEIEAAQQHIDAVLPAVEQIGDPQAIVRAYLYQALLDQSRGQFGSAERWFQRAEQLMDAHPVQDLIQTEWIVFRGQFHLAQGDVAAALHLLSAEGVRATDLDEQAAGSKQARALGPCLGRYLLLGHALLAQGASGRATTLLERVCTVAEDYPDVPVLLQALSLRAAIAYRHQQSEARALSYLEQALNLAAPEGYVRPFLDAGMLLAKPLRRAIMQGIQPAYAQKLLAALSDQGRQQPGVGRPMAPPEGAASGAAGLVEPLTEREKQVLRLLAAGLTSTEVAEELIIAVSTCRSYIKSLYGKLDAHSRDEAVEKGHRYSLI